MDASSGDRHLISRLISLATIELHLHGRQREEVLAELVGRIPEIAGRPEAQAQLLRALQEREGLHSTGIGDGIALPHARQALPGLVESPIVVFGRHDTGVAYGSIDGRPVRLFFLLVTCTVTQHLGVLARISRLLRDPNLRRQLLAVDSPERAVESIRQAERSL